MALHIKTSGVGPPSTVPTAVCQHYVDTLAKNAYLSVGTTDVEDWVLVGGRGLGARFESDGSFSIKHDTTGEFHKLRVRNQINGEGVEDYVEETGTP